MTAFLSKLFGSKNKNHVSLVIHDGYMEVAQFTEKDKKLTLVGANRIPLEEGVVEKGGIRRESDFQNALQTLFSEAQPEAIQSDRLYINIPFEQIYPFVKTFSGHSSEDHMQMALSDMIKSHAPFSVEELAIGYREKKDGDNIHYGALAYPRRWKSLIAEACGEMGFEDLHFVPEPLAQVSLSDRESEGHFALFSWQEGIVFLSLFFNGLLFDSFALKSPLDSSDQDLTPFAEECTKAIESFKTEFNEPIKTHYFAGFPGSLRKILKKAVDQQKWDAVYLKETDNPIDKVLSAEDYSTTLIGLGLYSLNQTAS